MDLHADIAALLRTSFLMNLLHGSWHSNRDLRKVSNSAPPVAAGPPACFFLRPVQSLEQTAPKAPRCLVALTVNFPSTSCREKSSGSLGPKHGAGSSTNLSASLTTRVRPPPAQRSFGEHDGLAGTSRRQAPDRPW